jgi:iron complex transport system substrate-binding protein
VRSPGKSLARCRWLHVFLILVCVCPAGQIPAAAAGPIMLQQADGNVLELLRPATRLVTLSPHLAELVFAAGAGDRLAATVEYSNYPPEAAQLPRVGDAFRIDIERIHLLDPDLILGWQSGNPPAALQQLEELGFTVWTIEILRPIEIADTVESIGRASGTQAVATGVASDLRQRIDALRRNHSQSAGISYFYQVAAQPLYTVNGQHLISRGMALCAAENVFADLPGLAPQISLESVLVANPLVLMAPEIEGQSDPLAQWQDWPRLQAVNQNNFMLLPADAISRATPRFLDAVELACSMLDDLRLKQEN